MKDTTGAIMAKYLDQEYVKYFFGVPGAHVLPLANYRGSSSKPILTNQEATGFRINSPDTAELTYKAKNYLSGNYLITGR
jgi:hypothetical protein